MEDGRGKIVANTGDVDDAAVVRVEFYGLARERAGVASIELRGHRLEGILRSVEIAFPGLDGLWEGILDNRASFRLSLDGERFLTTDRAMRPGETLLILSADAGG
jgi:hypothetical protein